MSQFAVVAIVLILWIFSVCLHEFAHAWVAYRGGDYTVREKGYLDFNPLRYAHPMTTLVWPVIFIILGGIGLPGGAVYINSSLLRSRQWDTGVSLAGPAANLLFSLVIASLFWTGIVPRESESVAAVSLSFLLRLQASAIILNLLPIPPLDGYRAIAPWLSAEVQARCEEWGNTAQWILFLALWYVAPINHFFWSVTGVLTDLFGVDPHLAALGRQCFRLNF